MTYEGNITINYKDGFEQFNEFATDDLNRYVRSLENFDEISSVVVVLVMRH